MAHTPDPRIDRALASLEALRLAPVLVSTRRRDRPVVRALTVALDLIESELTADPELELDDDCHCCCPDDDEPAPRCALWGGQTLEFTRDYSVNPAPGLRLIFDADGPRERTA